MVRFNVVTRLVDTAKSVQKKILNEVKNKINRLLPRSVKRLEKQARILVSEAIQNQPEYQSLLGGKLQAELGVPNSSQRLSSILDTFINGIKVDVTPVKVRFLTVTGQITIRFDRNFRELLTLPAASYLTRKGQNIPWLRWLLLEGDLTIVQYVFRTTPERAIQRYSRTGLGLMFKKRTGRWTVPPEFAGTEADNFITRAIAGVEPQLEALSQRIIRRTLS